MILFQARVDEEDRAQVDAMHEASGRSPSCSNHQSETTAVVSLSCTARGAASPLRDGKAGLSASTGLFICELRTRTHAYLATRTHTRVSARMRTCSRAQPPVATCAKRSHAHAGSSTHAIVTLDIRAHSQARAHTRARAHAQLLAHARTRACAPFARAPAHSHDARQRVKPSTSTLRFGAIEYAPTGTRIPSSGW
eukprot:6183529-Pleurochrysis_carterae.AAC.1